MNERDEDLLHHLGTEARAQESEIPEEGPLGPLSDAETAGLAEALFGVEAPVVDLAAARRRRRGWTAGAGALAAAACLALWLRPASSLPSYDISVRAGEVQQRGTSESSERLTTGSVVEVQLAPAVPTTAPVEVSVFWTDEQKVTRRIPARVESVEGGGAHAVVVVGRDFVPARGAHSLEFVVARPGELSEPSEMPSDASSARFSFRFAPPESEGEHE